MRLSMRVLIIAGILMLSGTAHAVEDGSKKKPPRLKFKNGPVCMCTDGLSEKDIRLTSGAIQTADENGTTKKTQQLETSRNRDTEGE
jgi:hypothetical protein